MSDGPPAPQSIVIEVRTASEVTRLCCCGNFQSEPWNLSSAVDFTYSEESGNNEGSTTWRSPPLPLPRSLPLRLRFVANGHRSSPNTRPLIWDSRSRVFQSIPADGLMRCEFEPTPDNSDTGWVTADGVGCYQLRVGQPPGSAEALVTLEPHLGHTPDEVDVVLWEAKGHDPAVPQGKVLARVGGPASAGSSELAADPSAAAADCPSPAAAGGGDHAGGVTYLLNSQTVEALAFRVDVISRRDCSLLARCFVEPQTLQALEGSISAALVTPDLRHAGTFRASFLVVSALPHPANNLGNMQRTRWVPGGSTLDIGHRGSGASKVRGHAVRENTLLSFQKAALNHSEFIEFDVHVTADGETVVFHDFLVPIRLGSSEVVRLPICTLTYDQLRSPDFTQWMVSPNEDAPNKDALDEEKQRRRGALQRSMTSAEDLFRSIFKPQFQGPGPARSNSTGEPITSTTNGNGSSSSSENGAATSAAVAAAATAANPAVAASRWFLTDRIATLREAFRRTPKWLGFNIELKYPTVMEVASMRAQYYNRNTFVDAVLRVVLEEGVGRRVIFSTFDPDCATLLSLKQPRFPVLFLTCGGTKLFTDPRMNSLDAALQFALASRLQGVVAEVSSVLGRLHEAVGEFHRHGLFLYTWGDANNEYDAYMAQKEAGIDAIIMDDIEKMAKRTNKTVSLFNKPMRSPASAQDLERIASANLSAQAAQAADLESASSNLNMMAISAISPIGSPPASQPLPSPGRGGAAGGGMAAAGMPALSLAVGSPPGGLGGLSLMAAAGVASPRAMAAK